LSTRHIQVKCTSFEDETDLSFVSGGVNITTSASPMSMTVQEFQDKLERAGRLVSPLWQEYHLLHGMKRVVAETIRALRHSFDQSRGRFSFMAVDFVLDRTTLKPRLFKIIDHPELHFGTMEWEDAMVNVVHEVVRTQQILLKREWTARRNKQEYVWHRPEDFEDVLDIFSLVAFDASFDSLDASIAASQSALGSSSGPGGGIGGIGSTSGLGGAGAAASAGLGGVSSAGLLASGNVDVGFQAYPF